MNTSYPGFGEIEIDGDMYDHDMVIDGGKVRERDNTPSKAFRGEFGHTPLSTAERIPWGGSRLIVGTGASGAMPVMAPVIEEAKKRGVKLIKVTTGEACRMIRDIPSAEVHAVLHTTC